MTKEPIALQLFTIRNYLKNYETAKQALSRVKAIGYKAVEIFSISGCVDKQVKEIISDIGLEIICAHCDPMTILNSPEKIIQQAEFFGCKYVGYPWPDKVEFSSKNDVLNLAKKLNYSGCVLKGNGVTLLYHNHNVEFVNFGGDIGLDLIYQNTTSENLQAELDTYWIQNGGGDPVKWIKKLSGRLPLLHLKDYSIVDRNPTYAPVGQGNLDFDAIIEAGLQSKVEWYVVEQDHCIDDVFDSIEYSYNYLIKKFKCS